MLEIKTIVNGDLFENCYVLEEEGKAVVIDPGYSSNEVLKHLEKTGAILKYIILTHGHFDHISSAEELREKTGAMILCSEEERELLLTPSLNLGSFFGENISFSPDKTFCDGEVLKVLKTPITFMLTPGHTVGSAVIICGDNIFSGDTLFEDGFGRTDFPTGSFSELQKSIEKLKALEKNYKVYSGHGAEFNLHDKG